MAKAVLSSKFNPWGDDNPEKIRKSDTSQVRKAASILNPLGMIDQLFGSPSRNETNQSDLPKEKEVKSRKNEVLLYSFTKEQSVSIIDTKTNSEIKEIIQKLKEQVVLLEKSENSLSRDISKIKVEQLPTRSGIYYLRFFEWLLSLVTQLRSKVEEGRTWLEAMTSKKKKIGYWKMYKKHGTTFGLSHERSVSTQSG